MYCPVCSKEMSDEDFGVPVYRCKNGCQGIWFDRYRLASLDQKDKGQGEALEQALQCPRDPDFGLKELTCPRCSIPMQKHKYAKASSVTVDECYKCGGYFLDAGELAEIRNNYQELKIVPAAIEERELELRDFLPITDVLLHPYQGDIVISV